MTLTDRALPYQGIEFPGKMKVETHYYPGNPIATQQVIGSEEGSTTISGIWNDRFVGPGDALHSRTPMITVAGTADISSFSTDTGATYVSRSVTDTPSTPAGTLFQVVQLFDDIRRQGQQVRVSWGQVIRVGIMTEFKPKWIRPVDVEWSMTFEWASQGESSPQNASPAPSVSSAAAALNSALNTVASALASLGGGKNIPPQTPPNSISTPSQSLASIADQIATSIAAPVDFVNALNAKMQAAMNAGQTMLGLTDQLSNLSTTPAQIALQVAAIASYVVQQFRGVEDEIDALPSIYYYNVDLPPPTPPGPVALPIASITPAQMLSAESAARQSRKAARDARLGAATTRAQFAGMSQPSNMLSVFIAQEDQDLRRVSTQFYGNPNSWRELAVYNDLPTSKLYAGQLIFVPQIPPQTTAQGIPAPAAQFPTSNGQGG